MKFLKFLILLVFACGPSSQKTADEKQEVGTEEDLSLIESYSQDAGESQIGDLPVKPPNQDEVGVPYYPGADYIPSSGSGGLLIMFATEDSPEDVTEFYREKLEGWTYNETYGLFYEGSGDLGYADILQSRKSVAIGPYTAKSYQAAINITIPE